MYWTFIDLVFDSCLNDKHSSVSDILPILHLLHHVYNLNDNRKNIINITNIYCTVHCALFIVPHWNLTIKCHLYSRKNAFLSVIKSRRSQYFCVFNFCKITEKILTFALSWSYTVTVKPLYFKNLYTMTDYMRKVFKLQWDISIDASKNTFIISRKFINPS